MSDIQGRLQYFRHEYTKNRLKKRALPQLQQDYQDFRKLAAVSGQPDDNRILEDLFYRIKDELRKVEAGFKSDCPIAYMQPSYAQAQYLNAWHPEFEPHLAPEGYQSILDVSSVRAGKTYGLIMNMVLWLIPLDHDCPFFEEYEHPKFGKYRVLPRWDWDEWQRNGRRVFHKDQPPKSACEMWLGCVDENHYLQKVEPKLRQLFPQKYVKAREDGQLCWYKSEKSFETKFGSKVSAKLYNSDMTAWSGTELFFIGFDEGPTEDKIDESWVRAQYIHIAFTPREPANIGPKAALAKKIHKGEKKLVGQLKTFQFKMEDTEDYLAGGGNATLGAKRKAQRLAVAASSGEKGRQAVEGGFFDSSPQVFDNFKPELNVLPVTGATIVRAVRGESTAEETQEWPWLRKFEKANLLRGFDEGLAHPTAVCYDDQTEVLSENGWKLFKDLKPSELVATANQNLELEFQMPIARIDRLHIGEMILCEPRIEGANFCVTPDHRMVVLKERSKHFKFIESRHLKDSHRVPGMTVEPLLEEDETFISIPGFSNYSRPLRDVPTIDYAEFLGWFIAEGTASKTGFSSKRHGGPQCVIKIAQKKYTERMRTVFNRLGWGHHEYVNKKGCTIFSLQSRSLYEYMKDCVGSYKGEKRIPRRCFKWSARAKFRLLEALMLGDGRPTTSRKGGISGIYSTVCPELADDIQELCAHLGIVTVKRRVNQSHRHNRRDIYEVVLTASKVKRIQKKHIKTIQYNGRVFCVTVPNGTLVVRRGGKPMVCGNCWGALLRTGELVIYRDYEASDTSITKRVETIVELSGNKLEVVNLTQLLAQNHDAARFHAGGVQRDIIREQMTGQSVKRYREVWVREAIRRTFADSKIFRRDPNHPLDNWTENYRRAGLSLDRARSEGPAFRCDLMNTMFRPDHTRDHLNPGQGGKLGYGCQLYLTRDCVLLRKRVEEYLWEQFKSGPRIGEFTGKPSAIMDDLNDACGYLCNSRLRWIDPSQYSHSLAHS